LNGGGVGVEDVVVLRIRSENGKNTMIIKCKGEDKISKIY